MGGGGFTLDFFVLHPLKDSDEQIALFLMLSASKHTRITLRLQRSWSSADWGSSSSSGVCVSIGFIETELQYSLIRLIMKVNRQRFEEKHFF